ncbi:putative sh3 domain-containing protein [Golovinomyces cichoracearum]|uniref:Putative sh3 domain-containing protein n=1 Tax=Golovinomyces cichoracearum TaxID=62708 RepID=A0A420GZE2_9PEZI|nr:putative sh3 domain-containing protein [Golovinomyces cichoracearum]
MPSQHMKVKSLYEYVSQHNDDLPFPAGQIIVNIREEDDEWYSGEYVDESGTKLQGIFPKNFVEKYEPAPSSPDPDSRHSTEKELTELTIDSASTELEKSDTTAKANQASTSSQLLESPLQRPGSKTPVTCSPPVIRSSRAPRSSTPSRIPSSERSTPPHVFEKPASNSFKDRVAAFNKASSSIPAPFKPGGMIPGDSRSFIKKPFIAPPPSKNAYIPLLREHSVPTIPRCEEEQVLSKKEFDKQEKLEKPSYTSIDTANFDQTKPTSLKERIALLQKQQLEQASRLAEVAQKKEKLKRPAKKQAESTTQVGITEEIQSTSEICEPKCVTASTSTDENEHKNNGRRKSYRSIETNVRTSSGDGNDADVSGAGDDTTETDDKDEFQEKIRNTVSDLASTVVPQDLHAENEISIEKDDEDEDEDEDEDTDIEIRRKEELRARMAKMSGGMGMHGIFGPVGALPMPGVVIPPKKKSNNTTEGQVREQVSPLPVTQTDSMTTIPLSDTIELKAQEIEQDEDRSIDLVPTSPSILPSIKTVETTHKQTASSLNSPDECTTTISRENQISSSLKENALPLSPRTGSESDDELSPGVEDLSLISPFIEKQNTSKSLNGNEDSLIQADQVTTSLPVAPNKNVQASRLPPPIPTGIILPPIESKNPQLLVSPREHGTSPPVIPAQSASEESDEVTAYEGDCDTDIASSTHYNATLKAHNKDAKIEEIISPAISDSQSSISVHPVSSLASREPPPQPLQLTHNKRLSIDMPKSAPPPPPGKPVSPWKQKSDDYDAQSNGNPRKRAPSVPSIISTIPSTESKDDDIYFASPLGSPYVAVDFIPPPLPPRESVAPLRESIEATRSTTGNRRSIDLSRISLDSGYMANDVDLAPTSYWWVQPHGIPPVFQGRNDIRFESDDTSQVINGKNMMLKELYILFQDYSQTIISAQFDTQNPANVELQQKHEQPPSRLRQDLLEQAHEQIGKCIFEAVTSYRDSIVGDGTPQGLITELLSPLKNVLLPIGARAYGALVYGNIANASTQQIDEIRPGDIITIRNARFQGKHGPLSGKYTMEVGKPHHVGVVAEWDGTKKKIRAWEQGRESKKVKLESFKLDDLRSGEVKIWRVMPRSWVGWEGQN